MYFLTFPNNKYKFKFEGREPNLWHPTLQAMLFGFRGIALRGLLGGGPLAPTACLLVLGELPSGGSWAEGPLRLRRVHKTKKHCLQGRAKGSRPSNYIFEIFSPVCLLVLGELPSGGSWRRACAYGVYSIHIP